MTKAELLNNAKRIQAAAQELLDKTSVLKTDIGNSLQAAKRHESKLISKERAAEAERREKEKAERLIEYLNSDEQRGVYVSDRDSAAGNAAAGIPADAGTEKAPKAEAEKVQGEPRPENADRKPEKGAQKPEPPEQKPVQPAPKPEENKPEKAAEREQEQNVDKPAEHKPEKAEPVRNNVADKVADSVNDAQETKDKNNKEMPGANKETKQNSEQAAKAKNTAEKTEISAKSDSSERVAERTENAEQPKKNESPEKRIGLLDRKLRIVSENVDIESEWIEWAKKAFKSVYGFDWQGDNVLLARENLLRTFIDYYAQKFDNFPIVEYLLGIAEIISWNIWQMDGLKYVIPNSCQFIDETIYTLFGEEHRKVECEGCKTNNPNKHNGIYCYIMDWSTNKRVKFVSLIKK